MQVKNIDGFNCEFTEEYGMTSVMIEKGNYCSSLDFADDTGELLSTDTGNTIRVSPRTLAKIRAWADSLGY